MPLLSSQHRKQRLGSKMEKVDLQEADRAGLNCLFLSILCTRKVILVLAALADIVRLQEMQSAFHWLFIVPYDEMES
jgi:hypothetical protein